MTFGIAYYGAQTRVVGERSPTAVWLSDGAGRFTLAHFSDRLFATSVCNRRGFRNGYFLKTADPLAYNFIVGGCYPGAAKTAYTVRTVTPDDPLTWLP